MNIKNFYCKTYPTDELGVEINDKTTFVGLLNVLHVGSNVYDYIGIGDSIVRERLFTELAESLNAPYDYVYYLWLGRTKKALALLS